MAKEIILQSRRQPIVLRPMPIRTRVAEVVASIRSPPSQPSQLPMERASAACDVDTSSKIITDDLGNPITAELTATIRCMQKQANGQWEITRNEHKRFLLFDKVER